MKLGKRDGLWLAMAVLLHALLLLIPLHQARTTQNDSRVVSITLLAPRADGHETKNTNSTARASGKALGLTEPPPAPQASTSGRAPPAADVSVVNNASSMAVSTTAATLLHSASRLTWARLSGEEHRQLGVFKPGDLPANWRPGIILEDNRFDDAVLPARTEIVDRWLAADGSHKVVIRTARGNTLCGRTQAWNPMNPLFEPVMLYHPCGGGGKRTFRMPHPYQEIRLDGG